MAKRRIKKPVRKKKSDYPGEMSFRKALGMNPTYYQEGGKLYYQEDIGELPTTKYGTPEYEEAYRTGNLLVNGVRPLPEFKVTPEYKSLSDELRRAAILGIKGAAELTGVPGAVRFARSPVQSLKGAGNTIVDLGLMAGAGLSPVGRFGQMNPMGGAQYAKQGTNPLTGQGSFRAEDVEGAFNTLDAVGIATIVGAGLKTPVQQGLRQTGKYLTQGPLRNTYKLRSSVLKENPEMFLYRAEPTNFDTRNTVKNLQEKLANNEGTAVQQARWKNYINEYNQGHPKLVAQNDFHGQWLEKDPARLDWYLHSGDKVDVGTPMSIFRTKIPTSQAAQYNVGNIKKANVVSASPETEFVMPRNIIEQGEKFPESSWQQLIQEDKAFNTPHWWKGYKQINTPKQLPGSGTSNSIMRNAEGQIQFLDNETYRNAIVTGKKNIIDYLSDPRYKAVVERNQQIANRVGLNKNLPIQREMNQPSLYEARLQKINEPLNLNDPRELELAIINNNSNVGAQYTRTLGGKGSITVPRVHSPEKITGSTEHEVLHHIYPNLGEGYPSFTPLETAKVKSVFKPSAELRKIEEANNVPLWYLDDVDELVPNTFDLARGMGIKKFDKYPGKEAFKKMLDSYQGSKSFVKDAFKLNTSRDYKRAWDMLSGVRVGVVPPAAIIGAGAYGVNQMQDAQPTMRRFGGKLKYARGGSLTSAQDTAQAADLNQDIMRKDVKKASVGEDFMAGLYGVGEGVLDTLTFGLTDELTDAGFKALQAGAGHDVNSDEAKRQAGIKGWGNVGGAVTGALVNPASAFSAGQEGLEGIGQGIQGINPSNQSLQAVGKGVEGLGNIQLPKGMESMEGMSKLFMARNGGRFKYGYRGGGHMLSQNMGLTEIDGPSHEQGGVTLPNSGGRPDVEVEGPETIYTPENYVMSEKMKASKEALEYAGIIGKAASRLAGKSYADLSKSIKSKAGDKLRPADPLSKKMLDKEMKRLMMAHEYDREAKRMKDEAMRSQMMGGSNVVAETPEERAGGYNMYPNAESIAFPGNGATSVVPTNNNDPIMVTGADGNQQMLTDEPIETEAPFIEQKMAQGGKMIKRADGSYSRRGLWDNIRANRGSGRKPTKQMLEQEAKIKAAEKAYGGYYADGGKMPTEVLRSRLESHMSPQEADNYLEQYADGGSFNNPGFRALPGYVQAKIKSNMALGGDMAGLGMDMETANSMQGIGNFLKPITQTLNNVADIESQNNEYQMQLGGYMGDYIDEDDTMEYGEGGYTVRKSNDRKGKTHVVTGPDGTKKYFGDPNLGERGKSKYGKDAFYARHKKNLAKNPYFRAYARATWEDGGYMNMLDSNVDMVDMQAPMYQDGGSMMYGQGGGIHIDPSKRGTFKAQASRMGMGVQQAASSILNAPEGKYSPAMRKKANFARNFAKADGGYMYQMGGEMMAQQPQGQPQGGGEEEIMQQVAQMLQQGMAPEEIVGQLVQMGVPQEQAIQIVQMIVQQMQGQQQAPQEAPQQAPPMMRRGGYMHQMGGEMAPQQAPQQGGDQEQIMQAIVQMLQQGLQPEQIVGELVKMGIPQEAAIQAVQMVMQQAQQSQGMQQQQQAAPPFEQGMMSQQGAPATMRGGGRMYQMGGSLADTYLQNLNKPKRLFRNGGKLYYEQDSSFIPSTNPVVNGNKYPSWYKQILDFESSQGSAQGTGLPNYGIDQSIYGKKYPDMWSDNNITEDEALEFISKEYQPLVNEYPEEVQKRLIDYAYNTGRSIEDLLLYTGGVRSLEEIQTLPYDPNTWNSAKGAVLKGMTGDNYVTTLDDAKRRVYQDYWARKNTPNVYTKTSLPRVNMWNSPQQSTSNTSQANNQVIAQPLLQPAAVVPQVAAVPSNSQSNAVTTNTAVGSTPTGVTSNNALVGKPEKYQQWQPNTAPIVAGGLSAGITPIANLVASITGRDTRAAAPLKFEKPDYTPVAIQRAAANQALANTREALRRGSPTQGNYLSNLTVTAPSLAANVGREIANKRFEIGKSRAEIDMREQAANDQNRKFNIMNRARDQGAREQLRLEAARGFSTIGQGVTKDLGETLYEANILRNLETKDFSPFNYIRDEKGRFKQVLSPRGAAIYRDNTTNNQIVTDDQGNSYMILPGGKIQLIQKK